MRLCVFRPAWPGLVLLACLACWLRPGTARAQTATDTIPRQAPAAGTSFRWRDTRLDLLRRPYRSPLYLDQPSNVNTIFELTPDGLGYYVYERVGGRDVRPPTYITRREYEEFRRREAQREYWRRKSADRNLAATGNLLPGLNVNSQLFSDIFGSGRISFRPNVTALIDLSVRTNVLQNPALSLRQQRNTFFDFRQQLQMNLQATVGERLRLMASYDTEATFNFENQFKAEYLGMEDDVLKKIEVGNVSMPLNGSLITGGQNLFGVKAQFQIGPAMITTLLSQQRGRTNELIIRGSDQALQFSRRASEYDENRHFFLSHYFRSLYEQALANPPLVLSRINVTRVEVWVTNRNAATTTNTRNGLGLVDLGEGAAGGVRWNPNVVPTGAPAANESNNLYRTLTAAPGARDYASAVSTLQGLPLGLRNDLDFEVAQNLRRLNETEYVLQPQLGYISLNQKLQPNDVLFVAFEYTITGQPGTFRVGEFGNDIAANANNTNLLFVKMLKPSAQRPVAQNRPYPAWDLMMKNVYSLNAFNINPNNFRFEVVYEGQGGEGDVNYLPAASAPRRPLIQLLNLDRLTNNNEAGPDNRFDFLPRVTIDAEKGLVIFPNLEPLGDHIARNVLQNSSDTTRYAFPELYRLTQVDAYTLFPQKDRYKFRGVYSGTVGGNSGGLDIDLNAAQIVPGSVRITGGAGGTLTEGVDYTVDYQIGRVTLLNANLRNTAQEMRITWESNVLFGIDQRQLLGTRVDYRVARNLMLGGTLLYMNEIPLINKVVIGEEPMSNLLWGLDGTWNVQSRGLTRALDALPFYKTQAPSNITLQAEWAQLNPGVNSNVANDAERGIAYIDDFEGTISTLELGTQIQAWQISSVPGTLPVPAPSGLGRLDSLRRGFTRGRLSWYNIDARFFDAPQQFGLSTNSPALTSNLTRRISQNEIFRDRTVAQTDFLATFDLQFDPRSRGPYNFEFRTSELNPDGTFRNPQQNWAGIMRRTTGNTDFEAANFEYVEFWLLDPFDGISPPPGQGDLYLNLGRVSEDVLPDNRLSFEHGLPTTAAATVTGVGTDSTAWARVPQRQATTNAFDNNAGARPFQDVGLDGVGNAQERTFFNQYVQQAVAGLNAAAAEAIRNDPSSDDFRFFTEYPSGTGILERYRNMNGLEGNSPIASAGGNFAQSSRLLPDIEDINLDNTPNLTESYWEYRVSLRPTDLQVGQNFIVDRREVTDIRLANNATGRAVWYQFRIPIRNGTARGGIQNFKAIDFIRLYMTGFNAPIVTRMAQFRVVSTQWRSLPRALRFDSLAVTTTSDFRLGTVGLEENSRKTPFNYVLPPAIQRQGVPSNPIPNQLQNEQSLQLQARNLPDGEARAAFKNLSFDLRFYKRIKVWVHAEAINNVPGTGTGNFDQRGQATAFMRIGGDYTDNFYEVEIPLTPSDPARGFNNIDNIWANQIDVSMDELTGTKVLRNSSGRDIRQRFTRTLPNGHRITVVGNPQLNNTKVAMLGLRNPPDAAGQPISVEVWFNEFRVTDFDTYSGWAGSARLTARLADLGDFQLSAARVTPGFGDVQDRIFQRTLDDRRQWDVATNLQLGKLLPEKAGLEIPVFFAYGERYITPLYNPLDPDVRLETELANLPAGDRERVRQSRVEYQRNISYAINNLRRNRTGSGTPRFWDIENWSVSYAFSEIFLRNAQVQSRIQQTYFGSLNYQFSFAPKNYQPFRGKKGKSNLLTEFNFFLLPQQVGFRLDGNRYWEEEILRSLSNQLSGGPGGEVPATYVQNFTLTRTYTLRWDLTRSLGFTYTASDISRVDEPRGRLNTAARRDSLWRNVFNTDGSGWNWINMGRTINFTQNIAAQYRLPFQYFKPLDWWSANAAYTANYQWLTAALQNERLGNTINNQRTIQADVQFNFVGLYKKFPFIARLQKPIPKRSIFSEADSSRRRGDNARIAFKNTARAFGGLAFSLQSVDLNYQRTDGSTIPGFLPAPDLFGLDMDWVNPLTGQRYLAPGLGFLLGEQPNLQDRNGWWRTALENGWITADPRLAAQWAQLGNEQITGRVAMQLFRGLRVDFTLNRQSTENASGLFSFVPDSSDWRLSNEAAAGTYSISYFAAHTAFRNSDDLFREFERQARPLISQRLREANTGYGRLGSAGVRLPGGYWNGYTGSSQDVLIPAFLSTYGPYSTAGVGLTAFPKLPLPNWRINFQGLSDVWFMKEIFRTVTLTHGYTSSYNVSWLRNLRAVDLNGDGFVDTADPAPQDSSRLNFLPGRIIQSVLINETFSPLLGINLTFHNGISLLTDYKRGRTLLLNVGALQLTESQNEEITLAAQWRKEGRTLPLTFLGRMLELKNNFTIRMEATIRNTTIRNRRLESTLPAEPTGGNRGYTLKPSIDYNINTQVTARAYYEFNSNTPVLSNSFPSRYIAWGIQIRVTLQ